MINRELVLQRMYEQQRHHQLLADAYRDAIVLVKRAEDEETVAKRLVDLARKDPDRFLQEIKQMKSTYDMTLSELVDYISKDHEYEQQLKDEVTREASKHV